MDRVPTYKAILKNCFCTHSPGIYAYPIMLKNLDSEEVKTQISPICWYFFHIPPTQGFAGFKRNI